MALQHRIARNKKESLEQRPPDACLRTCMGFGTPHTMQEPCRMLEVRARKKRKGPLGSNEPRDPILEGYILGDWDIDTVTYRYVFKTQDNVL